MAIVKFIDGTQRNVQVSNIRHVGDEGARTATAHFDGKEYEVYNNPVDGNTSLWFEQMSYETYKMLEGAKKGFVEGTATQEERK